MRRPTARQRLLQPSLAAQFLLSAGALSLGGCGSTAPETTVKTGSSALSSSSSASRAADLALLQGTWRAEGGLGATKVINGNREMVTYQRKNGAIIGRFVADFEVQRGLDDAVRLLVWRNLQAVDGKAPPETSGAYVFNTDGQRLVEYRGAYGNLTARNLADAIVWTKVSDENGQPPGAATARAGTVPAASTPARNGATVPPTSPATEAPLLTPAAPASPTPPPSKADRDRLLSEPAAPVTP
jgi:hypothetical protein